MSVGQDGIHGPHAAQTTFYLSQGSGPYIHVLENVQHSNNVCVMECFTGNLDYFKKCGDSIVFLWEAKTIFPFIILYLRPF